MKRNRQLAFEQQLLRTLRSLEVLKKPIAEPARLLLACSGGLDSMVLLETLGRLQKPLGIELIVAHVHHGAGHSRYRQKAWEAVRQTAAAKNLLFVSNSLNGHASDQKKRTSESELREYRYRWLFEWQKQHKCEAIVVAHHYQDLLETRLMRLIRGTGAVGLRGMSLFQRRERILRPLLMVEKARIIEYATSRNLKFIEDPSNKKTDVFRNWIREWLGQLDVRHSNGTRNLARSLSELVEQLEESQIETRAPVMTDGGIDRLVYRVTSKTHQKAHLARYCHHMGLKNYTKAHIEELIKRLDARKKQFTFEMLQCVWSVTPERIKASRLTGRV
jgi:tRNA(Ile)-lysidine synthase